MPLRDCGIPIFVNSGYCHKAVTEGRIDDVWSDIDGLVSNAIFAVPEAWFAGELASIDGAAEVSRLLHPGW